MPDPAPPPPAAGLAVRTVIQFKGVEDVILLARTLYAGGVTPAGVDRPEKLVPIIIAGMEVGLGVMQSVESIYMTNGRPSLFGDVGKALILQSGLLEYQRDSLAGEGDDRKAVVVLKRRGQPERTVEYPLAQAKRLRSYKTQQGKGGPWADDPDNMLLWRAKWRAWRAEFPDVLRGLTGAEEEEPVTVEATVREPAPASPPPALPATRAEPTPLAGSVTPDQLAELKRLAGLVRASLSSDAEFKAAWAKYLADFGVATAKDLSAAPAADLTVLVGGHHDPLTYPAPF